MILDDIIIMLKSCDMGMHRKEWRMYDPDRIRGFVFNLDHSCIGTDIELFFYCFVLCCLFICYLSDPWRVGASLGS